MPKAKMKERTFEVPKGCLVTFFNTLEETGLEYSLTEVDDDEDLVMSIMYDESERGLVMDLIEVIDEYYEDDDLTDEEDDE